MPGWSTSSLGRTQARGRMRPGAAGAGPSREDSVEGFLPDQRRAAAAKLKCFLQNMFGSISMNKFP